MLVGDAITACGLSVEQPDGDVIVVAVNQHGTLVHRTAVEVAANKLGRNFYQAGGVFKPGAIVNNTGRKAENLVRIVWLAFDADLSDYLGWEKEDLWGLDDETLLELVEIQRADLERVFRELGLTFTRLDYTGYGLCGYLYLDELSGRKIEEVQAAYKGIVSTVNQRWGNGDLVDRSVSDAGTRITRIPGSINDKGPIERLSRTLSHDGELYSLEQLQAAAGHQKSNVIHLSGPGDKRLTPEQQKQIIEQMAPVWTLGQKHLVSLGLAGMLAKAGIAQEQTLEIVREISARAGDERPDDRVKTVLTTYRRLGAGEQTAGYFSLKGRIPDALLGWMDQELSRVRDANVTVIMPGQSSDGRNQANEPTFKAEAPPDCALTGWFAEYCDLVYPTTEAPVAFHLASAWTVVGSLLGRSVGAAFRNGVYGNLFTLLIGKSGRSKKDTAIETALGLVWQTHLIGGRTEIPNVKVRTDLTSSEGMLKQLQDFPNLLLYITEFKKLIQNSRRESTQTIQSTLIEAFNAPPVMENLTKTAPIEAHFPMVSILAAVQPDVLGDLMGESEVNQGFANRWLFVFAGAERPVAWPDPADRAALSRLYLDIMDARSYGPSGRLLALSEEARSEWKTWYETQWYQHDEIAEDEATLQERKSLIAVKLALIYAVMERADRLEWRHLQIGIEIVDWSWRQIKPMIPTWGGSVDNKIQAKILDTLQTRGPMTRRDLQRYAKGRRGLKDYHQVFEIMLKTGDLQLDPQGRVRVADG